VSWTDEELRGFNALSDQLVAQQQTENETQANKHVNGHHGLPGNVHPLRSTTSSSQNANLAALLDALRGYLHLDDDGHVLFALAVAVSAKLDGDPLWAMIIGPSSGGKTETLRMVDALADERVDELTAASLLSWSKGKNPRPTGILTRVGDPAFVTVADFSTVLATSDRGGRDQLFALLRRVYDGCAPAISAMRHKRCAGKAA
jgi:hypothetical protein